MLSSLIDETADKLAASLRHHIHNISPRHLRRPKYRNTLATLSPTLSRRRSRAPTNHNRHKTPSRRDNRKANNTTLMRRMPRCTRSRNRTSRTMPRRTMMATTATAACPCPRHTKLLVVPGSRNSETTNSPLAGTEHAPTQGILSDKTNALFRSHTWQAWHAHDAYTPHAEIAHYSQPAAPAFVQCRWLAAAVSGAQDFRL